MRRITDEWVKRCPRCGCMAQVDGIWTFWVMCMGCHMHTPFCSTIEEAVNMWNDDWSVNV